MIGLHADLDGALRMALRQTIAFLSDNHGLTREDAYALSSMAVDFEISQVVNGIKGVHAMIPKAIFS
jgi:acetamidase/formamidase